MCLTDRDPQSSNQRVLNREPNMQWSRDAPVNKTNCTYTFAVRNSSVFFNVLQDGKFNLAVMENLTISFLIPTQKYLKQGN